MRTLMFFTIGFAIGCAIAAYFLSGFWMLICAVIFAIIYVMLLFRPNVKKTVASIIIIGVSVGLLWMFVYDLLYMDDARKLDGTNRIVSIEASDFLTKNDYGYTGLGKIKLNGKAYNVQFSINDWIDIYPGDKITGEFRFRFTGKAGELSPTHHQGKGIFLLAYAEDTVTHQKLDKIPVKYFAVLLRKTIIKHINDVFPKDVAGFARSLLLGDTTDLSYEDDAALKISGIRHIVAVSGLHVSILLSFAYIFSRGNRYLHAIISIPLLFVFAAIAGFTPSIVRACFIQGVVILAIFFDSEHDVPTAFALAILLLLLINPLTITSVSLQLSAGCVIGIMLFSGSIHDAILNTKLGPAKGKSFKSKLIRTFTSIVSVTLSTMIVTAPISGWYFGSLSIVSVFTNLLTLPIITFCFYGVVISCILSFIFPILGTIVAWFSSWPLRYILLVAKLLSKVPFASVSIENTYFMFWILFCYLLLATFILFKKKRVLLLIGIMSASLLLTTSFAYFEPRIDNYRMTVLDVGQGQCIILQSKDDCYVIDCGGDYSSGAADLATQTLRSCGIQKIDGLIITHFDKDHSGGVEYILAQMPVERIYAPEGEQQSYHYYSVNEELALECGLGEITIMPGEKGKTGNESSLCILFQALECDILITGDRNVAGEKHLIDHYNIPQLDILVAGHHGADSSTSLYLLNNTMPSTVIISVGENNRFGHPDRDVLRRLNKINALIYRTDKDGTVIIRG